MPPPPRRAGPRPRGAFTACPRGPAGGRLRRSRSVISRPLPPFPLVTSLSPQGRGCTCLSPGSLSAKGEVCWAPPCGPPRRGQRGPAGWSEDMHLGRYSPLLPPGLWLPPQGESVQAVEWSSCGRCFCSLGLSHPEIIARFSSAAFLSWSFYQS